MFNFHTNKNSTISKTLIAFKPRQVLLNTKSTMSPSALKDEDSTKITSLTPELKSNLHDSILHYLNRNGFSKSAKRFQSEAQIQSETWKTSSLHLEDIFCKYYACDDDSTKNTRKEPDNLVKTLVLRIDKPIEKDNVCSNEEPTKKKKKKKGTIESDNGAIMDQLEVVDKKVVESERKSGDELETKPKKKKTKNDLDSSSQAEKTNIDTINGLKMDNSSKKTKEKRKNTLQDKLEPSTTNENGSVTEDDKKERKKKKKRSSTDSAVNGEEANTVKTDSKEAGKEKLSSKKRKRSLSDDNDNENGNECLATEVTTTEESKRQKIETFKEENSKKKEINIETFKEENSKKKEINVQETDEQLDGQANGKLEINGVEKSDAKKSTKKQRNVTDEPKTVNAFQRVNADQVEFAHEKLQDNSYWAKDGADIGYGAKAQEVLGQVRGRDFRHEKTKKKRGSYRGGLIDLQSHSIKFNYSDEE